jgi:hypothetical protein
VLKNIIPTQKLRQGDSKFASPHFKNCVTWAPK